MSIFRRRTRLNSPTIRSVLAAGFTTFTIAASPVHAQGTRIVRGVVTDTANRPVSSVGIQIADTEAIVTDDSGRFRLQIPHHDRVVFDVRRVGFMPSRYALGPGGDTTVEITMYPVIQTLATVEVKATQVDRVLEETGFNQRMSERTHGTNSGIFITAAEIEKRHANAISQIFEDLPGVTVCRKGINVTCGLTGNHLVPNEQGRGLVKCQIPVYLDGQRLNSMESANSSVDIDAYVLPGSVAGVEFYPSGNRIPPKYQMLNGSCGLVLVWTKRG